MCVGNGCSERHESALLTVYQPRGLLSMQPLTLHAWTLWRAAIIMRRNASLVRREHNACVQHQRIIMDIAILGAPMDLGAGRRGVDMGPSAIRCAGLGQ